MSLVCHLLILSAFLMAREAPPKPPEPSPIEVSLVSEAPSPSAAKTHAAARTPAPRPATPRPPTPKAAPIRLAVQPKPAPLHRNSLPADDAPAAIAPPVVSEAQLIGATTADSGPSENEMGGAGNGAAGGAGGGGSGRGGGCNMARRLQNALRKDPLVQAAARTPGVGGKALMVWNGDWVQGSGEDGKGLAAVREAIMWEVAFAPAACRAEPVHGLVLLSLNDAPGTARLVVGVGGWRWSDLLAR
jgi:hypothetical protein